MRLLVKFLSAIIILILASFALGAMIFWKQIPTAQDVLIDHYDAIVVLTGGSGRIELGFKLLNAGKADKLFISGVSKDADKKTLLDATSMENYSKEHTELDRVYLGYDAHDTTGNAFETEKWARENNVRSLILVTSNYHIPRSLLEFRLKMPDVKISPHAIAPEDFNLSDPTKRAASWKLFFREYIKYLAVYVTG